MNKRDNQIDNIKGIMIFLVVFGHMISRRYGTQENINIVTYLYNIIYSFHMPVFIFISGYLSKRHEDNSIYVKKAISSALLPYLVFHFIAFAINACVDRTFNELWNIWEPSHTLWFLLSLFFWKLLAEPFSKFRYAMVVTIILALYAGFLQDIGTFFALSKTICFFPFFLFGYLTPEEQLNKIRNGNRHMFCILFAALLIVICITTNNALLRRGVFQMKVPYSELDQTMLQGALYRFAAILAGFLSIFFFHNIVPKRESFISKIGAHSMIIYLVHPYLIKVLQKSKILNDNINAITYVVLSITFSAIICLVFGKDIFFGIYKRIMNRVNRIVVSDV